MTNHSYYQSEGNTEARGHLLTQEFHETKLGDLLRALS